MRQEDPELESSQTYIGDLVSLKKIKKAIVAAVNLYDGRISVSLVGWGCL